MSWQRLFENPTIGQGHARQSRVSEGEYARRRQSNYSIETSLDTRFGYRYVVRGRKGYVLDTRGSYKTKGEAEKAAHAWLRAFLGEP